MKKGFTLVELLSVIVVLALLLSISIVVYTNYEKKSQETLTKVEKVELMNAAAAYFTEFKDTDNYKYYEDANNKKYSCVSVQTLIDIGYYKQSVDFIDKKIKTDSAIKIVMEKNGVINYELVSISSKGDCTFINTTSHIDKTDIDISDTEDVVLKAKISPIQNVKNNYYLTLDLDADVFKMEESNADVYVMIVLDTSNSMRNNGYDDAISAAVNLSQKLVTNIKNSQVALINFDTKVELKRNFKHASLTKNDFSKLGGGTNILDALDMAYEKINNISNKNAMKYVIFLSDGEPAVSTAKNPACNTNLFGSNKNDKCISAIISSAQNIKNAGSHLIFIGYNLGKEYPVYKEVATIDNDLCSNSSYHVGSNNYCYFDSNSSKISTLFNNLSTSITTYTKPRTIKTAKIYIQFNNAIKLYDSLGNIVNKLNIDINFDDTNDAGDLKKQYKYTMTVDTNAANCSENTCKIPLFDSNNSYFRTFGYDGTFKTINPQSPMININNSSDVYIN